MIVNITAQQWEEIQRYFKKNSDSFTKCSIWPANYSIDLTFNNQDVEGMFITTVLHNPDYSSNLPWRAWRAPGKPSLDMEIRFEQNGHSNPDDLNKLNLDLQTFRQKINAPLTPEQCKEIKQIFSTYSGAYAVLPHVDNEPAKMQLKFNTPRSFEQFKTDVAINWDIASYHYDDENHTVTISMDNPQGLQKFNREELIHSLKEMNKNNKMTRVECREIQQIFEDKMDKMGIPIQSSITSNDYNSLDIDISFKTAKQAEEFEKEVLPNMQSAFEMTTTTSMNKLGRKLSITQYDEGGYDITLMSIDPAKSPAPTETFGIKAPFQPGFDPKKPTLIKYGNDYWLYGNTDGNHWKTQKLASWVLPENGVNFRVQELHHPQSKGICSYIASIQGHTHEGLMNEILMRSFDHMEAKFSSVSEDFGFHLSRALISGMTENSPYYPQAVINVDNEQRPFVCILTIKKNKQENAWLKNPSEFEEFFHAFPQLCYKHQIDKQTGRKDFACRKELPNDFIKYEFYIPPEALHNLMMEESDYYRGYRSGHSIADLANPTQTLVKKDVMCLFPVFPTDENHLLIRNAGCNVSEVLSTQLSFLAKEHLPEVCGTLSTYGHHTSPIMTKLGIRSNNLIKAALMCTGMNAQDIKKYGFHEAQDGLVPIQLEQSHHDFLKEMDSSAKQMYSISALTPKELEELHSFEVPMPYYLEKLVVLLQEKEKTAAIEQKPAITKAIQNIQTLMNKITQTAQIFPQHSMSGDDQRQMRATVQDHRAESGQQNTPTPKAPSASGDDNPYKQHDEETSLFNKPK